MAEIFADAGMSDVAKTSLDPELERIAHEFDGQDLTAYEGFVDFFLESGVNVIANRRRGGDVRARFYFPPFEEDFEEDAADWVEEQPVPSNAVLELDEQHGFWAPRLVAERQFGNDWRDDPVRAQLAELVDSWKEWTPDPAAARSRDLVHLDYDPVAIEPASAWLLFSGAEGIPTLAELRDSRRHNDQGDFDFYWTAAKHVEPGDLVLIYAMRPIKAVTHVARAATRARLDDAFQGVDRPMRRARKEHWVHLTAPVEIDPIPLSDLQAAANDHLLLRGNAQFLRPEWIEKLTIVATDEAFDDALTRVARVPAGQAALPHPQTTTFAAWREIAAGALFNERLVERHIVEPLLRMTVPDLRYKPQFRVEQRKVDYALLNEGRPSSAIEVKLAIEEARNGLWLDSPDFQQVRWYADRLGVNSILIDAYRVLLIHQDADEPHAMILRRDATERDLEAIRQHLRR